MDIKVDFDQAMKRQQMYKTEEGRAMLAALLKGIRITADAVTATKSTVKE